MARPKQDRQVATTPKATYFKPRGIPMAGLEEVRLSVEELEALRLADLEGRPCCQACRLMGVSRHTFGRVLTSARRSVAEALVAGKALRIEGGNWVFAVSGDQGLFPDDQFQPNRSSAAHCPIRGADKAPAACQAINNKRRSWAGPGPEEETE